MTTEETIPNILRYWRDGEFFQPFHLSKVVESHSNAVYLPKNAPISLPWLEPLEWELDESYEYGYEFYFAPFQLGEVRYQLGRKFPGIFERSYGEERELSGESCFARVSLDGRGFPLFSELSISTLPWALESLLSGKALSLTNFDAFVSLYLGVLAKEEALSPEAERDEDDSETPEELPVLSVDALKLLSQTLTDLVDVPLFQGSSFGILVPRKLRKKKDVQHYQTPTREKLTELLRRRRKVDILNSFYLRDIERVATMKASERSLPLCSYLGGILCENVKRIDVLSENSYQEVHDLISVKSSSLARWPSPPELFTSFHQQLVVNALAKGENLLAVQGAPGTGKTFLVRDIIAERLVKRACTLAKLGKPEDGLTKQVFECQVGRRTYQYRALVEGLKGYEIVVASNNNVAVENISKELPKFENIDEAFHDRGYLFSMAQHYSELQGRKGADEAEEGEEGPPTLWGLPSVALGRLRNRLLLRKALFLGPSDETDEERSKRHLRSSLNLFEWRAKSAPGSLSFLQAKKNFKAALEAVQNALNSLPLSIEDSRYSSNAIRSREYQNRAPWQSVELNLLRSRLFFAALELHESWIRHLPRFDRELQTLSGLLRTPQSYARDDAERIWPLLFLITPVVSTTLASVERMFSTLGPKSLGLVIIDEGSQATPQSGVGIIARAKQLLILGDQNQLEPVCSTPPAIDRHLAQSLPYRVHQAASPLCSSIQRIGEEASRFGTQRQLQEDDRNRNIGLPLLIHRRCHEPMFSLSNSIAYEGRMIKENLPPSPDSPLGESQWFPVKGIARNRHWVVEEGHLLQDLIRFLFHSSFPRGADGIPDFFVITPFRAVRAGLLGLLRSKSFQNSLAANTNVHLSKRVGTIHTFQGRQASIVFLVLGCDMHSQTAADWAGEKPNLLNVAITRARDYLYVIGDNDLWHNRGYFSDLEKMLPCYSEDGKLRAVS